METTTTMPIGCDIAADAPKAYVLLPVAQLRPTGGVRLRAFGGHTFAGAFGTAPSTAPPGPPLTT